VTVGALTSADARACGEADLAALRRRLGDGSEPAGTTSVWRVTFTVTGPDDRLLLADRPAQGDELDDVLRSLARLDGAATGGPWTRTVRQLIADHPQVVSTELAAQLGRERQDFKRDVRKLKERGLTRPGGRTYAIWTLTGDEQSECSIHPGAPKPRSVVPLRSVVWRR